ncbi:MAG: polysaccharide pyruvyl transferase family protein [Acutalibacteraceae bacterium]
MDKITLLDTCIGSTNRGDDIIMKCIEEELSDLTKKYFVLKAPTHLCSFNALECLFRLPDSASEISNSKYKFVCGTNLLSDKMMNRTNQWNINIFNCKPFCGSVLMGVGAQNSDNPDFYTRRLYKKVLSNQFIHSVREEKAYSMMKKMGFSVLNTGCPTLWKMTDEFCSDIPVKKSENVVFTLTDYKKSQAQDKQIVELLKRKYNKLYFWIQGAHDFEYLKSLTDTDEIEIIEPQLTSYEKILENDVDYVGTRLHAGIYAMRHKKRSIIIRIDSRMDSMACCIPNNCVSRDELSSLKDLIDSEIISKVNIDFSAVEAWKGQFES